MARPKRVQETEDETPVVLSVEEQVAQQIDAYVEERNEEDLGTDDEGGKLIEVTPDTIYIPSGSRMLNIACSDSFKGAFVPGRYVNLVGDSSAGKSLLALSMLAEMANDPIFDNYRFIYDDAEEANSFDVAALFGSALAARLEPPNTEKVVNTITGEEEEVPLNSDTIQEFQLHVFDAIGHSSGRPFIYILDSFDSITSKAELETAYKNMDHLRKGTKETGSYGMDKPKIVGQILRMIKGKLKETSSFLLVISQTRDDINPMTFTTKTRSGGNALKFYASHEIWLAVAGKIKKTVLGHDRIIGVNVKAKLGKNKLTGKLREVEFPIYYSYGIDDISACVDFVLSTNYWKLEKKTIIADDLGVQGTRETLIKYVEEHGLEEKLFAIANARWNVIEDAVILKRKKKFA